MNRTRRHHSSAFKQEAVALVTEQGCSCVAAGCSLGLSGALTGGWKEELKAYQTETFPCKSKCPAEQQRIHQFESENHQLRMERDSLKKTTAFFARESA